MSSQPPPNVRTSEKPTTESVTIRRVETLSDYDECVVIERETWGSQFTEAVPSTILRIAQEVGGVTAAAFGPDGAMLGFVFGITGVRDGELAHWSDMLAVRVGARDMGLGKKLKAYQRDLLLEIGVRKMYWTYDPLVARNAYLNLDQLGARVVEYRKNFYGEDTGSVMHAALGTDRFIVAWQLDGDARRTADPTGWGNTPIINEILPSSLPDDSRLRVAIPNDIFALLNEDVERAIRWHQTARAALTTYLLDRGYSIAGFRRGNGAELGAYLLAR